MKTQETIKEEYTADAMFLIQQNEDYIAYCAEKGLTPKPDERLPKFADINKKSKEAKLNLMKLDQQINETASNEVYNHIDYIRQAWTDAYFEVDNQYSDHKLETDTATKRKSASNQFEEDYSLLLDFRKQQEDSMIFYLGNTPEEDVELRNPLAYKAYKLLDEATVKSLKYNVKKIQKAIILKENSLVEIKLLKLLDQTFKVGLPYSNEYIKSKLQEIYTILNIKHEDGEIEKANAKQLGNKGWFEIKECKIPTKGKPLNGFIIIRKQFNLKMAA